MGTGWRRVFCTSTRRESHDSSPSPSPRSRLSLFAFHTTTPTPSSSTPSTPRHHHPPQPPPPPPEPATAPSLRCRTAPADRAEPPKPPSPRSPSRFTLSLLRSTLGLSRGSCGICLQSVKAARGTAIFIAECSHAFHFPCISTHVKKHRALSCPVCSAAWRQSPRLSLESPDDPTAGGAGGWRAAIERVRAKREQEEKENEKEKDKEMEKVKSAPTTASAATKAYNDDEPLLSPGGSRFNPIPEAEEDDQPPQSPDRSPSVELAVSPEAALLSTSRGHDTHVVSMKVRALVVDGSRRAPVDIVAVVDAGGNTAAAKFHVIKSALRAVISSLDAADRLSIVAFSSAAKRFMPLRRMAPQGQRAAARVVDRLVRTNGGGASSDALRKANRILEDRRERNAVACVVLLYDAQQQQHRSKPSRYESSVACWASCTTSASGGTRYAHVEVPVTGGGDCPPETALANCVSTVVSVVAQDVRVEVSSSSGEIIALYSSKGHPPATRPTRSVLLGDLYADEERELLVEIRTPAAASDGAMIAKCSYRDPTSRELATAEAPPVSLPGSRHRRQNSAITEAVRSAYVAARAVSESRRLTVAGELSAASQLLTSARAAVQRSAEGARTVEAELAEVQRRMRREASAAAEEAEALTPTSAWRAAERLAKVAMMRKSLNRRVSDLHGFEDARF